MIINSIKYEQRIVIARVGYLDYIEYRIDYHFLPPYIGDGYMKQVYVIGWFVINGGSGTLPKVYTDKEICKQHAIELQKSHERNTLTNIRPHENIDMRYFMREYNDS